jgi:hypothetical protein
MAGWHVVGGGPVLAIAVHLGTLAEIIWGWVVGIIPE